MPLNGPHKNMVLYLLVALVVLVGFLGWRSDTARQEDIRANNNQIQTLRDEILVSREGNVKGRAVLCQQVYSSGATNSLCDDPDVAKYVDRSKIPAAPNSAGTNLGVSIVCDFGESSLKPEVWAQYADRCAAAKTQPTTTSSP